MTHSIQEESSMKKTILVLAVGCALIATLGHHYAKPVMAQVRAALVQNIDEPGRAPLTLLLECNAVGSYYCDGTSSTAVPANKRFVVQYVNGGAYFYGSGAFLSGTVGNGELNILNLESHLVGTSSGFSTYTISMPVVAYFEAGQTPAITMTGTTSTNPSGYVFLTGYLIDLTE
jgi:hypothetical protein